MGTEEASEGVSRRLGTEEAGEGVLLCQQSGARRREREEESEGWCRAITDSEKNAGAVVHHGTQETLQPPQTHSRRYPRTASWFLSRALSPCWGAFAPVPFLPARCIRTARARESGEGVDGEQEIQLNQVPRDWKSAFRTFQRSTT